MSKTSDLMEKLNLIERSADPADVAAGLIKGGSHLTTMLEHQVSSISKALNRAAKAQKGLERVGAGQTESVNLLKPVHKELKKLNVLLEKALAEVAKAGLH